MFYFSHESRWFNSLCSSVVLNFGLTGSTTMFPIYSQVICDNNRLFTHFALISSSRSTGSCFLPELWLISGAQLYSIYCLFAGLRQYL